jgi:hypothetical protein
LKSAIRVLTVAIIGLVATAAAGNAIRLNFTVEPEETLPLVPVTFRVRAINTGSTPAALPLRVRLDARTGSEDWKSICFANWEHEGCATFLPLTFEGEWPPSIELAPGEERVLDYLPGPSSPPWANHRDLLKPGTYRLRLVTWGDYPDAESIMSNEVVLTIQTPTGADAGAWQLISGLTHVNVEKGLFADQLWSQYPNSVYTAMTPRRVPVRGNWNAYINAVTEALGKNPPPGFADSFKHGLAYAHLQLMDEAMHEFNVQKAFQHAETTRALLQELVGKETEHELKAEATKLIEQNLLTLAEIEEVIDRLRLSKPEPTCERAKVKLVRSALVDLMTSAGDKAKKTLADAITDLDKYDLDAAKTPPDMHAALASLEQATSRIETVVKSQGVPAADGTKALKSLAGTAELSARRALDASANEQGAKQSDLDVARQKLEEGRAAVAAGDFKKAISRFREALHKAQGASSARASFC